MRALERLPIGKQKFALGSWLAHKALDDCRSWCATSDGAMSQRVAASKAVGARVLSVLDESQSGCSIADFLADLPSSIAPILARNETSGRLLAAIDEAVTAYMSHDADPFEETFVACLEAATRMAPPPDVRLRFRMYLKRTGTVHDFEMGPQVGGSIDCGRRGIDVELHLTADSFAVKEARAVPYALFHEIIAHAFAARHARSDAGPFAEGWMDVVAFQIHEAAIQGRGELEDVSGGFPFGRGASVRAGRSLHDARYTSVSGRERATEVRFVAREAAERCLEELAGHIDATAAQRVFWAFSLATNRSDLPAYVRDEACEALGILLQADEPHSEALRLITELADALITSVDDAERTCELAREFWLEILELASTYDSF